MKTFSYYVVLALLVCAVATACSDSSTGPVFDDPEPSEITTITDETTELSGQMRGTLRAGRTYTMVGDVIIPPGEEIVAEEGVTVIASEDDEEFGFEFTVQGSFISLGTEQNPNLFTVPENLRTEENLFAGLWGGFQATEDAEAIVLKWTRMEYLGGEGAPGTARAGSIRYGIWTLSDQTEVVLEDSWIYGVKDDFYRPVGGKINIVRNVFEYVGEDGGDIINIKGGTVGNVAYNIAIGGATNAFKPSDDGASTIQTDIAVYNNTILNSGFRRAGLNRGANINFENGARGKAFNNLLINNKRGLRVLDDADVANIAYDYNWLYGSHQEIVDEFIPSDSATEEQPNDVMGGVGENDPLFVNYDIDAFSMEDFELGIDQPANMNTVGPWDFRLQSGSPALGAGTTDFEPIAVDFTLTGNRAPTIMPPSADMGAYPADGSGNRQN